MTLSTNDLPIPYAYRDPARGMVRHLWAVMYRIITFCWPNADELELLAYGMIHETVNISRLKKYTADLAQEKHPTSPVPNGSDKAVTIKRADVIEAITLRKCVLGVTGSYKYQITQEARNNNEMA